MRIFAYFASFLCSFYRSHTIFHYTINSSIPKVYFMLFISLSRKIAFLISHILLFFVISHWQLRSFSPRLIFCPNIVPSFPNFTCLYAECDIFLKSPVRYLAPSKIATLFRFILILYFCCAIIFCKFPYIGDFICFTISPSEKMSIPPY